MMRGAFPGHRRYSITHRAVQRLRELVLTMDDLDDESLRDRLDEALARAEDAGKAVRTLDAMLGEPQVLIPLDDFGEVLYAIIKEDTVVTVLPQGHGEEILQRGQALQARVANGEIRMPKRDEHDRWEMRRRWRRESPAPTVIERHRRHDEEDPGPLRPNGGPGQVIAMPATSHEAGARRTKPEPPTDPIARAVHDALERGSRKAAIAAIREMLRDEDEEESLLPLWNELADQGVPHTLTIGDLLEACRSV
jgi:hypothetical protein